MVSESQFYRHKFESYGVEKISFPAKFKHGESSQFSRPKFEMSQYYNICWRCVVPGFKSVLCLLR
jgi:hypothetical protein